MRSAKEDVSTNALFGFARMVETFLNDEKPSHVAIAFDKGSNTYRHRRYPEYKATRSETPKELKEQIPISRELTKAYNIATFESDEYEADDIVGSLATSFYDNFEEIIILTSDHDMLQLVNDKITVKLSRQGVSKMDVMTPEAVFELKGVRPDQIVDMKALMGDPSDNIPGIPGVGEKTAVKLLKEFDNLNYIYGEIEKIKGKLQDKVRSGLESALLSQHLAKLDTEIDHGLNVEDLEYKPDHEGSQAFLAKYEMFSLM